MIRKTINAKLPRKKHLHLANDNYKSPNYTESRILKTFEDLDYKREKSMWKAVIMQALVDMSSQSNKKMAKINKVKAVLWANLNNKDFLTVCSLAGLDAMYVYNKVLKIRNGNS